MKKEIPPVVTWLFWLAAAVGCFVGAGVAWQAQNADYALRIDTLGTVVEMKMIPSAQHGSSYPIVQFDTPDGESHAFAYPNASYPPAFREGQGVRVLYHAEDPAGTATIDEFLPRYQGILMLLGAGVILGLIGSIGLVVQLRANARQRWFRTHGRTVRAKVEDVRQHRNHRNQSLQLYTVRASGEDPTTGERRHFEHQSKIDRLDFLLDEGETITVYVDPNDPDRYWMDLEAP